MRHGDNKRKFGRVRKVRRGLFRSLAVSFIEKGAITTTEEKAKEIRPIVERLVTLSKGQSVSNRRIAFKRLGTNSGLDKLFKEIAPKYKDRSGGFTRIIKLPRRKSDGAKMARISFV